LEGTEDDEMGGPDDDPSAKKRANDLPDLDHEAIHDDILKGDVVIGTIAGEQARVAVEIEHRLSFLEAVKLYPTAIGWSVFFSLGVIMTAFDPQVSPIDITF
jgi:hypothetical protein